MISCIFVFHERIDNKRAFRLLESNVKYGSHCQSYECRTEVEQWYFMRTAIVHRFPIND